MLTSGDLSFNSSSVEGSSICLYFMPVQDMLVENNETFNFNTSLSNPLDMFITDNIFTVYIQDDDGKVHYFHKFYIQMTKKRKDFSFSLKYGDS